MMTVRVRALALALLLTLTACGASAGPTPAPAGDAGSDAATDTGPTALSGSVRWTDGCQMNACVGASHSFTVGSGMQSVTCRVSGTAVTLQVFAFVIDGQSFDESREGLRLTGTVASERLTAGMIEVRGNGWAASGPVAGGACMVTATADYTQRRIRGSITCDGLSDDAVPANARTVTGTFDVTGCAP